jgi:ATP-binding cassette, subfamily B, multidrug efflux pump
MNAPVSPDGSEEEAAGRIYDRRLAARLLGYVRPYRALVLGALALLMVEGALQLVGPFLTRLVIDEALPAGDYAALWRSVVLFLLALLASFAAQYGETVLTAKLGQHVMHDLRLEVFTRLQRLPVPFYDRTPVGRSVTRVTTDVEALNELFTAGVVAGIGDLFTLGAIGIVMIVVDWRLALAAFLVIPFVHLVSHVFQKSVREAYRQIRTRLARINAFLQERITGIHVMQLFGREADEIDSFDALNRDHLLAHLRSIRVYALYFPAIEVLTSVALAMLIVAGAGRVGAETLTVGTVAAFLLLVRRFFQPLQDLSDKFNTLQQAMAASERVFALLDEPLPPERTRRSGRPGLERPITVEFSDVWFHYGSRGAPADGGAAPDPEWVLRGVSFIAHPGRTLALVGQTGAGKTTIVNLLLGFYEAQRGAILVNGVDTREIPEAELRGLIGYVQQDIFLFATDIAGNISLSSGIPRSRVEEAAQRVGADRLIRRLPRGYEHRLGERGSSISVGERQLLSFARAIAADPAVLVLDEATSAVDSEIEGEIQKALGALMLGRTTIAIAHRLSTIRAADEILVMHHGEVKERGAHRELMQRRGLYERLYRLQAGAALVAG